MDPDIRPDIKMPDSRYKPNFVSCFFSLVQLSVIITFSFFNWSDHALSDVMTDSVLGCIGAEQTAEAGGGATQGAGEKVNKMDSTQGI